MRFNPLSDKKEDKFKFYLGVCICQLLLLALQSYMLISRNLSIFVGVLGVLSALFCNILCGYLFYLNCFKKK